MRTELAPYENQFAYAEGWYTSKRHASAEGESHLLIQNVKVWLWDGFSAINRWRPHDVAADHLWITDDKGEDPSKVGLLEKGCFVGRIHQYARANGSVDYGIKAKTGLNLDFYMEESGKRVREAYQTQDQVKACETAIEQLQYALEAFNRHPHDAILYSQYQDLDGCKRTIQVMLDGFQRDLEATKWRLATSTANGSCQRLKAVSQLKGRGMRPAAGFGGNN